LKHLRVLELEVLCDGVELDVGGALVDAANLAVPVELLLGEVARETHAAHPLDALGSRLRCHL
jgi:hypothetical protein